jgi:hypothetical protein
MPRVKIHLRADPNVITDPGYTIESALYVRLCTNEHTVADLESFNVLESHAASDTDAIAEPLCSGTPYRAPH